MSLRSAPARRSDDARSLAGYSAEPNGSGSEQLFAWFAGGDFEFPSSDPAFKVRLTECRPLLDEPDLLVGFWQ
jgi:hypothetical protein